MATNKDVYDSNYKKVHYDSLTFRVKKGKKEYYRQAAELMNIGLMEMLRQAVEEFIALNVDEYVRDGLTPVNRASLKVVSNDSARSEQVSAADEKFLAEFNKLSPDIRKVIIKLVDSINHPSEPTA